MPEQIIEMSEGCFGDLLVDILQPAEGHIVIHGSGKSKGTGRTDEVVTLRQQA